MFDDTPTNLPTDGDLAEPMPITPPVLPENAQASTEERTIEMPEPAEPAPVSPPKQVAGVSDIFAQTDAPDVSSHVSSQPTSQAKKGLVRGGKSILIGVGVLVVTAVAVGAYFIMLSGPSDDVPSPTDAVISIEEDKKDDDYMDEAKELIEETKTPVAPVVELDSDGDGLSDAEEAAIGTSSRKPDTDNDGLFDRDEVEIYMTNPLNPDSDGDTFLDGDEVRNGYSPNGNGRLLEIPKE